MRGSRASFLEGLRDALGEQRRNRLDVEIDARTIQRPQVPDPILHAHDQWQWRSREDGKQFGFFGTFTEVIVPSKMVHEQYYDQGDMDFAMPAGDPCIVSLELSEQNGVTTLVCNLTFASKEARDDAVSTGMTDGMEYSYTRLDDTFKAAA